MPKTEALELVANEPHKPELADEALAISLPFCACGRRLSECDHSRAGCAKRRSGR